MAVAALRVRACSMLMNDRRNAVRAVHGWLLLVSLSLAGCKGPAEWERGKKYVHWAMRAKVGSFEPVRTSSAYDNYANSQVYEGLYTYSYLKRPYQLEPQLAEGMPEVSEDNLTYTFKLKEKVRFQDDACFSKTGGKGREVTAQDVIWSLMRMADRDLNPRGWWLYNDRIVGFDAFQKRMNARPGGAPFDWNARIEGLEKLDRYRLRITLKRPFPQFLYVLAMTYASVVPRECAEHYGEEFGNHAIGTGPFVLDSWVRGSRIIFKRNPTFRDDRYPTEAEPEFVERGLLKDAGKRVPFVDGMVFHIFEQDQPMWLKFRVGDVDMVQVPAEYYNAAFNVDRTLRDNFKAEGISNYNLPLLDFIYKGFNMDHPLLGDGERGRLLRQAIALAMDSGETNDAFYNGTNILYDGPIPPGLSGHVPGVTSPFRGPDLQRAKALLAKAGYPGGKGLPPIEFHTSRSSNVAEQAEMMARQLKAVGIKLDVVLTSFPELSEKLHRKKVQMFGLAWGADYPDAENFLALFYGPNSAPGSNYYNYKNPEFDRLYEQARTMFPSPEREALYRRMRELVVQDVPATGSMARTRFYLWNKRVRNVMPAEVWYGWFKYLDVDPR